MLLLAACKEMISQVTVVRACPTAHYCILKFYNATKTSVY